MGQALTFWLFLWTIPTADPPLTALTSFPPPSDVEEVRKFNHLHQSYLSCKAGAFNTPRGLRAWYLDAAAATEDADVPWTFLAAAQDPQFDTCFRRGRLGLLRANIGEDAFLAGRMPLPVPLWTAGDRD